MLNEITIQTSTTCTIDMDYLVEEVEDEILKRHSANEFIPTLEEIIRDVLNCYKFNFEEDQDWEVLDMDEIIKYVRGHLNPETLDMKDTYGTYTIQTHMAINLDKLVMKISDTLRTQSIESLEDYTQESLIYEAIRQEYDISSFSQILEIKSIIFYIKSKLSLETVTIFNKLRRNA